MKILRRFYSTLLLAACLSGQALALPDGANVTSGAVNIVNSGNTQTIVQGSNKAIINWNGFNIDVGELVNFVQPSSISAILNRVVGQDPSVILGSLRANGQVFLINPNGVVFGDSANVDVGSLVVSTLNIADDDFLQGNLTFQQEADAELASVINHGTIKVDDNGFLVLTGPMVANEGVILAKVGQVALAAGTQSTVSFDPTGMIQVALPLGSQSNSGIVSLSQSATSDLLASVVGSGSAPAGQLVVREGKTYLEVASGTLVNTGEIRADANTGENAGRVVLDSTSHTLLSGGSVISAAGRGSDSHGGEVFVLSDGQSTSAVGSVIDVSGGDSGDAGFVEQSGLYGSVNASVDLSASQGEAGSFLIDPLRIRVENGTGTGPGDNTLMLVSEVALEGTSSGTIILQADNGVEFEDLTDNALTLQAGVGFTIDLINVGGDASPAVSFADSSDEIVLSNADFNLTSVTGTDVNDLNVVVNGTGTVTVDLNDGAGGVSGNMVGGFIEAVNVNLSAGRVGQGSRVDVDSVNLNVTGDRIHVNDTGSAHDLAELVLTSTDNSAFQDTRVEDSGEGVIFQDSIRPDDTGDGPPILGTITANAFSDANVTYDTGGVKFIGGFGRFSSFDLGGNLTIVNQSAGSDVIDGFLSGVDGDISLTADVVSVVDVRRPITAVATAGDVNISGDFMGSPIAVGGSATGDFSVVSFGDIATNQVSATNINIDARVMEGEGQGQGQGPPFGPASSILYSSGTLEATGLITLNAAGEVGGESDAIRTDAPQLDVAAPLGMNIQDVGGNVTSANFDGSGGPSFIQFDTSGSASGITFTGLEASLTAPNGSLAIDSTGNTMFIDTSSQSLDLTTSASALFVETTNGSANVNASNQFLLLNANVVGGDLNVTNMGNINVEEVNSTGAVTLDAQNFGDVRQFIEGEPIPITGTDITLTGQTIFVAVDAQSVTATSNLPVQGSGVDLLNFSSNLTLNADSSSGVRVRGPGSISHGTVTAATTAELESDSGDITQAPGGRITAPSVSLTANNVTAETDTGAVSATAPGSVTVTNFSSNIDPVFISAGGDASFTSVGTATLDTFEGQNLALDLGQPITGSFSGGVVRLAGTEVDVSVQANEVTAVARTGDAAISSTQSSTLTVTDSSAAGDFDLNHAGDVEFNRIEAQNVTITTPGDITDTGNTIVASGITLNGNNVFVNTEGQVIVVNAQGNVTVSNEVVDVTSLTIDAQGNVQFDTQGNLNIASVAGGQLVSLTAGGSISADPNNFVSGANVELTVGGTITPSLDAPLNVQASESITISAPGGAFQGQGLVSSGDIAAALEGSLPASSITVDPISGNIFYNGVLIFPISSPELPPPVISPPPEIVDTLGQQSGEVIDDGSVGSAANDGLVEQSPTQKLVAQLTENAEGGGEGLTTSQLLTFEVDELGELKVSLSEPSPFDKPIEESEDMTADDVLDLETGELVDVKVAVYYDVTNDQLVMAVDLRADDIIDLDVSEYELIPLNLEYSFLGDPTLLAEALRADDLIDLAVEDLGNIPIRIHIEGASE